MFKSMICLEFERNSSRNYPHIVAQIQSWPGYSSQAGRHRLETRLELDNFAEICLLLWNLRGWRNVQVSVDGHAHELRDCLEALQASPVFRLFQQQLAPLSCPPRSPSVTPCGPSAAWIGLDEVEYAVLDFESTGLGAEHRALEVGIVVLDCQGRFQGQYTSLINPERTISMEAMETHGILPDVAATAPPFALVADDILIYLAGRVVVAHNAAFGLSLLEAEFRRLQVPLPRLSSVCTRGLGGRLGLGGGTLSSDLARIGAPAPSLHNALSDAQSCAALFAHQLARARQKGYRRLSDLGCETGPVPLPQWPYLPYNETIWTRCQARAQLLERRSPAELTRAALLAAPVCLTGDFSRMERSSLETMLRGQGIKVLQAVSRNTGFLIAADPHSLSSKARKARQLGVPIVPEAALWSALDGP